MATLVHGIGIQFPKGNTGVQGVTGIDGVQGVTGIQGETGVAGATGVIGTTGLANFLDLPTFPGIAIAPVLLWNQIDEALYAGITGVGHWVQISSGALGGPVGDTGAQGPQGVTGPAGSGGGGTGVGIQYATELPLGNPSGGFSTGLFPWDASTMTNPAMDQVNAVLLAISPAAPGTLTGALVMSNTTKYSAILPTGLTSAWYQDGQVAGNTITDYINDNTYNLASPSPSTAFKAGSTFGGDEGTVYHVLDGVNSSSRDMTAGTGTTGTIQITSIATYNTIWRKANAQINYTQTDEGYKYHAMRYQTTSVNQLTSNTKFWYDNIDAVPSLTTITVTQNTLGSSRYLSGVRYYSTSDTFDSTSSISNIAKKAIRPTNPINYVMSGVSSTNIAIAGASFAYDGTYNFNPTLTINASNAYSLDARLTITATKPSGASASATSSSQNRLVNTYSTGYSSNGNITMFDEEYRYTLSTDFSVIPSNYSDPTGNWASSTALSNGNAVLYNSTWNYPSINYSSGYLPSQSVNYSSFSGDQVVVWAANIGVSHSSMRIVFTGIVYTNISAVGAGDLNLEVRLPAETSWLDAGKDFGDGNGCRLGTSSGGTLNMSFGTSSSSGSSGVVFIRATLRTSSAAKASAMVISGT